MATFTHTRLRLAMFRRAAPARAAAQPPCNDEAASVPPDEPTPQELWNWTESAVLGGYGPPPGSFLQPRRR